MSAPRIEIRICQPLKPGELFEFYRRNNICEEGYGPEACEKALQHEGVWVAAYAGGELVSFARALHDGLHGVIMEICLDLRYQTQNAFENGCFVETDPHGVARDVARVLLKEPRRKGCCFFSAVVYGQAKETEFYKQLGFYENGGHQNYIIDARPYVANGPERGKAMDEISMPGVRAHL